jgi:serine/threonine protein kinase
LEKSRVIENGATIDMIMREINIHRRLIHENIVRLHSFHEDNLYFYLIMDYISKGTLYERIKMNNELSESQAFKYFIQVVSAVYFLHENNLIHRDLKPENLLIDDNNTVKLCDFGWCVEVKIGNRVTFCGTFEYMAPELIKELPYNHAVDVWSLGVLLYEMVHGYSPFRTVENSNQEYTEIFKNILKNNFFIDKKISPELTDLIKSKIILIIIRIID